MIFLAGYNSSVGFYHLWGSLGSARSSQYMSLRRQVKFYYVNVVCFHVFMLEYEIICVWLSVQIMSIMNVLLRHRGCCWRMAIWLITPCLPTPQPCPTSLLDFPHMWVNNTFWGSLQDQHLLVMFHFITITTNKFLNHMSNTWMQTGGIVKRKVNLRLT